VLVAAVAAAATPATTMKVPAAAAVVVQVHARPLRAPAARLAQHRSASC
jgi:hypothetical protein